MLTAENLMREHSRETAISEKADATNPTETKSVTEQKGETAISPETDDKQLRDTLVENNLRLVHSVARRFTGRGIEYEELYSAGCVGLVKAAQNFDTQRGLMFSTYAVPVIMGEIRRMFRDGGSVKVSRSLKELSLRVIRARERLASEKGDEPRLSELADALGISPEDVSEAIGVLRQPVSLTDFEDGGDLDVPIEAPQLKLTETIALKQILNTLPPKDRRLIFLRYWGEKNQYETGKALNMSQVQVSRREKKSSPRCVRNFPPMGNACSV